MISLSSTETMGPESSKIDHFEDAQLEQMDREGVSGWEKYNRLSPEDKNKVNELTESLQKFQKKTGIDESRAIQKLRKAKSSREIQEIEEKIKRAGTKWYAIQLRASGIFEPMDDREAAWLQAEFNNNVNYFANLNLDGDYQMIDTVSRIKEDFKPQIEFRKKLKKQSKFVKQEYFRRINALSFMGSKKELLEKIRGELKGVEDEASAVQYEFQKKQKKASASKDTQKIVEEVKGGFEKRKTKYFDMVLKNLDNFGGKMVQSPYGKLPLTAVEFLDWFLERDSFAAMDDAIKKLPGLVKQRKQLYGQRDEILKNASKHDQERITKKTNLMRRHELEAYLPELKEYVKSNSIHVAEYEATLISARHKGVPLILPFERAMLSRRFRLVDADSQASRIKILEEDLKDRARVVENYLALPSYLRNNAAFINTHDADRERMLREGLEAKQREDENPFEIHEDKILTGEDTREIGEALTSVEGQRTIEDIVKEMEAEGQFKAAEVQNETYQKIFGTARRAQNRNETQKESYLDDLRYWVRLDQEKKLESDATTDREKNKIRFIGAADEAYEKGKVMTSSGIVSDLQEVSAQELQSGSSIVKEKLQRAKYGEHVHVASVDGSENRDPLKMIERMSEQEVARLALVAMSKLAEGHMGMGGTNLQLIKNSNVLKESIGSELISREFDNMRDLAA